MLGPGIPGPPISSDPTSFALVAASQLSLPVRIAAYPGMNKSAFILVPSQLCLDGQALLVRCVIFS